MHAYAVYACQLPATSQPGAPGTWLAMAVRLTLLTLQCIADEFSSPSSENDYICTRLSARGDHRSTDLATDGASFRSGTHNIV